MRTRRLPLLVAALALVACGTADDPTLDVPPGGIALPSSSPAATAAPTAAPTAVPPTTAAPVPPPAPPAPAPASALAWRGCEGDFECATLTVPLVEGQAATVDLAVTRLRTARAAERIGSLVINPGGPGSSAVGYLQAAWEQIPAGVRRRFDLVAFDPRGVGRSVPVRCGSTAELDRWFAVDPTPEDSGELDQLVRTNAELAAGCARRSGGVLAHVSTADAARDLDKLRAALGDEKLTYLGYSYGTSIGAAYLDAFPTRARALVLDGALDPQLTWDGLLEGQSKGFDRALEAFMADCQARGCAYRSAVEGDLLAAYDRLVARVDGSPLPTGQARTAGPAELYVGMLSGLYSKRSGWPAIADALAAAERGDGAPMLRLNDGYLERGSGGYANLVEALNSVVCVDRQWPRETAPYTALAERVRADAPRFGPAIALSGSVCRDWPVPPTGSPKRVTAPGSPPVLVIGTTGDPATPYPWSVALADQLSQGVLLTYRGEGHTVYRASAPACVRDVVDRYLLTAAAPPPTTC